MIDAPLRRNLGLSLLTLVAGGGTLVCCVLPAVMVWLGAGAALAGLVTAIPHLVWLSAHKGWVFGVSAAMLAFSGLALWHARSLPCPADARRAAACARLRGWSAGLWFAAAGATAIGALFAFGLPLLRGFADG